MATRAEIREDFAKRLFAVAISVGFATTIARMEWIKLGEFPTAAEFDQILILITGLIATALQLGWVSRFYFRETIKFLPALYY